MTDAAAAIGAAGAALVAARDQLNTLDSAAGDGDLGITAGAIGIVLMELAPELAAMAPMDALRHAAMAIGEQAPSTFGTLVSLGLVSASRSLKDADVDSLTPTRFLAQAARAFMQGIETRGKAAPGDKTMLDAIGPAVETLERAADGGADIGSGLVDAARAAELGTEGTRELEARVGRQSWLAERSRGQLDAGAVAVTLVLRAAADAIDPRGSPLSR